MPKRLPVVERYIRGTSGRCIGGSILDVLGGTPDERFYRTEILFETATLIVLWSEHHLRSLQIKRVLAKSFDVCYNFSLLELQRKFTLSTVA